VTDFYEIDLEGLRDLSPAVIDSEGLPRVMPAEFYEGTTIAERAVLAVRHGLYLLPTAELCSWLIEHIGDRSAIEIGAGNGRMAAHIGIPATDSHQQDDQEISQYYRDLGQAKVRYGPNVERLEAKEAVRRHRPQVVVGAWVTHRYNLRRHSRGGNENGPNLEWIFERIEEYVLIGNEAVHAKHPLWEKPHEIHYFPWLYSRAMNGSRDFIAIWRTTP
jgi:hypothetical protein